jgi:AraC-like DNA-binding protein
MGMKQFSKISLHWVRSMTLLVVIILSLCSIMIGYDLLIIRKTNLRSITSMTDYLQHSVDSRFDEIQKYLTILELHETNSTTKRLTHTVKSISYEQYAFSELISTFKFTNKLLAGILIYYPRSDIIIGDQGCFNANSYYALENGLDPSGYEDWVRDIKQSENRIVQLHAGESVQYCYVKSMIHKGNIVGYILLRLNVEELLRSTESIVSRKPSQLVFGIMLDEEILSITGNRELLQELIRNQTILARESQTITKNNFLLHIRQSQFKSIKYLNAYNLSDGQQPLLLTLIICIIGVILTGIVGVLFSIIISQKNTAPLLSILNRLGDDPKSEFNEYQVINNRIDTLFNEKDLRINRLQSQQNLIGGLFLNMVINTDIANESEVFSAAKRYDIVFENPYYLVGVIKLDFHEKETLRPQIIECCELMELDVTVSYLNQKYILLFNLDDEKLPQEVEQQLRKLLAEQFWSNRYTAALGRRYDSLISISTSYLDAMNAFRQNSSIPPGGVVSYREEREEEEAKDYIQGYMEFVDAVTQKRYGEAKKPFEIFFCQCCSVYTTVSELSNIFAPIALLLKDATTMEGIDIVQFSEDFFCYNNPKSLKRNIFELLDALASMRTVASPSENFSIAEKAKIVINRDYTDSLLGLYKISDELHVSNSHLSTTFKNTYGIGVVQYINQLRINLAKDLILNTSMNIKDIAIAVGFSSDISFIRVFKKYEAKTPNTLRKTIQEES